MHAILTSPAFPLQPARKGRAAVPPATATEAPAPARHQPASETRPKRRFVRHEGNPIRAAREKAGLSLEHLGKRLGVSPACVHYWETDGNFVGVERLRALRAALAPHFNLEAYLAHAERVGRTRVRAERRR
ncbi:helix-turn-helix domain-containing protein [Pseudoxanthomonas sp. SGD-10]|nr:helix-turn-helix domain-containing protein [Pseudoxanthomonas sp. SGD-10]